MAINSVKIFSSDSMLGLENKINDWLYRNKNRIANVSISHSSTVYKNKYSGLNYTYSAIIGYEEV